jgi:hypothetical protein
LQKHNLHLSQRCKDEVNNKLKEQEERKQMEEKLKIFAARLSFLLNKAQADDKYQVRLVCVYACVCVCM